MITKLTFFSGTDTATLSAEGNDMAHFVSLIVNNAGEYTAAITRKYKCVQTVSEKYTYPTWKNQISEGIETFDIEEEKLEWFNLDVVFENINSSFEAEMIERINEIKEAKKKAIVPTYKNENYPQYEKGYTPTRDRWEFIKDEERYYKENKEIPIYRNNNEISKQGELPFEQECEEDLDMPYGIITVSPIIVQSVVRQLITSAIILPNESSVDIKKWANSMESLYRKRFGSIKQFEYFASNYVDYLITSTYDESIMAEINNDDTAMEAILAYDVREELQKLPENPWLNVYINLLDDYII